MAATAGILRSGTGSVHARPHGLRAQPHAINSKCHVALCSGVPHVLLRRPLPRRRIGRCTAAAAMPAASWVFAGSTVYTATLTLLMVLLPRWPTTRRVLAAPASLLPLAVAYGALLAWSWQPDMLSIIMPGSWAEGFAHGFNPQFFPKLAGISTLFSRAATAASLWVHLLAVNLFAARAIFLDGLDQGVATWHTVLLCMVLAPLGLLSHALTKSWRSVSP